MFQLGSRSRSRFGFISFIHLFTQLHQVGFASEDVDAETSIMSAQHKGAAAADTQVAQVRENDHSEKQQYHGVDVSETQAQLLDLTLIILPQLSKTQQKSLLWFWAFCARKLKE